MMRRTIASACCAVLVSATAVIAAPSPRCLGPDGKALSRHRIVRRACADGDPRCDLDGKCDGLCIIEYCADRSRACALPRFSFCPGSEEPWDFSSLSPGHRLRTSANTDVYLSTTLVARCVRGRPGCVARTPICRVTVTGGVNATSMPCRVWVMRLDSTVVYVSVEERSFSLRGHLDLTRATAGAYTLGDGIQYFDVEVPTPGGSYAAYGGDYGFPNGQGSVAMTLSADLPPSVYGEPSGTLSTTLKSNADGSSAQLEITF
jgi:hypothetical protein